MKSLQKVFTGIVLPVLFLSSICAYAQRSDRTITPAEQKQIIDKAFTLLKANYIFPEKVTAMENVIYKKIENKEYEQYAATDEFLKHLDADLETLSNDRHIDIFFDPVRVKQIEAETNGSGNNPGFAPEYVERAKYENYLVKKVERLDGNVGYLKFNSFIDTVLAKKTLSASMDFIANSAALIIDLRQNGGGDSRTCTFLLSYFLPDSTLLMKTRSRTESTSFTYTLKDASVNKFNKNIPVYILTSKRTSSAAEAFAYALQAYKRAIIVGDTTNGEANPGYVYVVNKEMYIMIPAFESTNPVTKTNWQAKGVVPDIRVPADKALLVAQQKAYEELGKTANVAELRSMYTWMAEGLLAEVQPVRVSEDDLKISAGNYADQRHLVFENGNLFYYRGDNVAGKKKLIPIKKDLFALDGVPFFRVRLIKDEKGSAIAMEGIYDDGKVEVSNKL